MNHGIVRVLIVDAAASVRQTLREILESDPRIVVLGTAADVGAAARLLEGERPDVMMLDLDLPGGGGLPLLDQVLREHRLPVVVCSHFSGPGTEAAVAALARGAVEVIGKPQTGVRRFIQDSQDHICDVVFAAAHADMGRIHRRRLRASADVILPAPQVGKASLPATRAMVAIGASTGGTEALAEILAALPERSPGVVVVQHMPAKFTAQFAKRLDAICAMDVHEAKGGDLVQPGRVLVAPGGKHLLLQRSGSRYFVDVREGPEVNGHRPSIDVLFRSVARYAGPNAIGIILTGMGDDGARGLGELKEAGAHTIAQDEASSVVFGMAREAIRRGAVDAVLGLPEIAAAVRRRYNLLPRPPVRTRALTSIPPPRVPRRRTNAP
ncbi:MAG: chemotaxis-specific protein-glutamate methyltransferase CheB [Polyangiaceae bacterium]|nr:chemotaxis-specific protein-glutamate methyltransferase CheB [Polyangiaceae bacterium]